MLTASRTGLLVISPTEKTTPNNAAAMLDIQRNRFNLLILKRNGNGRSLAGHALQIQPCIVVLHRMLNNG